MLPYKLERFGGSSYSVNEITSNKHMFSLKKGKNPSRAFLLFSKNKRNISKEKKTHLEYLYTVINPSICGNENYTKRITHYNANEPERLQKVRYLMKFGEYSLTR